MIIRPHAPVTNVYTNVGTSSWEVFYLSPILTRVGKCGNFYKNPLHTRVGTLILATIYLQLTQNR